MQIINERPGTKAAHTLTDTTLKVGAVSINLAAEQGDVERRIIVYGDGEGGTSLEPSLRYVAVVVIPPQEFIETEVDEETVVEPVPLDLTAVALHLWPISED